MRHLLDSHALIWAIDDPAQLSAAAAHVLKTKANRLVLSAATIWEISIKVAIGRLKLSAPLKVWLDRRCESLSLEILPITIDYAAAQAALPLHHGDPFDRLLAAQALTDQMPIVSNDAVFDLYGVKRVW